MAVKMSLITNLKFMNIIVNNPTIEISRNVWMNLNGAERMLYTVMIVDIYNEIKNKKPSFIFKIDSKEQIKSLFNLYMWKGL